MAFDISKAADDIFQKSPCRFNTREKEALLAHLRHTLLDYGYGEDEVKITVHDGVITSRNMVIGNPATAKYFITAHYDTPGTNGFMLGTAPIFGQTGANIFMLLYCVPFILLEILTASLTASSSLFFLTFAPLILLLLLTVVPMFVKNRHNRNDNTSGVLAVLDCAVRALEIPSLRKKCCFIFFDNEEWGLVGSSQFAEWCRKNSIPLSGKVVLNLDCVGVGDTLVAASTGNKSAGVQKVLDAMREGGIEITEKRSIMVYMSDHASFRNSVMFSYMYPSKLGPLYIPNIHSPKDRECDTGLVDDLSARIIAAVEKTL